MYFSDLGTIALWLALGFALYSVFMVVMGVRLQRPYLVLSAQRAALVVALSMLLASMALVLSFLTHDFGVRYVAAHSSRSMEWYYVISAFYGGQEGSLLFWSASLALFSALFILTSRRAPAALVPYVVATLMAIEVFLLYVLATLTNPFARSLTIPDDGMGLNPVLLDPGMLIHPPLLLLGYMSFAIPFAIVVAVMITGQLSSVWLHLIRRWMLAAWTIQTAGLIFGMWWAYHVLGWGGFWGWDPVENAALMPWLTATAFLHSTMVQERRGMLKGWNLFLVVASFALSIFGTFLVRSGIINSVHSFAQSAIGGYFLAFLIVVVGFSSLLFFYRLPRLKPEQEFDSVVSREGVFLLNNLMLVGMTFAVLWGTLFPLISELVLDQTMTVGPPFYNQVISPLLVVLVLAMGVGPLLAWRRTSWTALWRNISIPMVLAALCAAILPFVGVTNIGANIAFTVCAFTAMAILYELWRGVRVRHKHGESWVVAMFMLFRRYRRRYGGYVVHLGLVLLFIGVVGSYAFQNAHDAVLKQNENVQIGPYQLTYRGLVITSRPDKETVVAQFQVSRDGHPVGYIYPGQVRYTNFPDQPTSIISISTFGVTDLYVFLPRINGFLDVSVRVFINPLVPFVWYGGAVMVIGGLLCWWPGRPRVVTSREKIAAVSEKRTVVSTPQEVTV